MEELLSNTALCMGIAIPVLCVLILVVKIGEYLVFRNLPLSKKEQKKYYR